uniref:CSON003886 protein n=1 Tax=Culicoides sonorensis TaxID=179676 RepID=A0A336MS95_CULSO
MGFLEDLPITPKCCCCISNLRIASIMIGTVSLSTIILKYTEQVFLLIRELKYRFTINDDHVYNFLVLWFLLLMYVMPKILLNILLIFGAVKKKATSISIYLWCNIVYFGLEIITVIIGIVLVFATNLITWEPISNITNIITFLVYFVVQIYFWLCVNSFYAELKLESRFSLRQQMRGTTLTNISFSSTPSTNSRVRQQQSFPLRIMRAS